MNRRKVFNTVGRILQIEAALLLLPTVVSLYYSEKCIWAFLIAAVLAFGVGFAAEKLSKPKTDVIYSKEGFAIVALAWMLMSLIGALPFFISGEIPSYIDAFFETVSGFTTTGASILTDVEAMSRGLLFWRSFTHWVGGMGVIVFIVAIIPNVSDRSMNILKAEMPGPIVGKIVPKVKDTAKILYIIYIVMTIVQIIFLVCGGMPLFESVVHAFGTAGTGGFGIKADGIGGYSSYLQWVITIFMLIFGVNFNLYYMVLINRIRGAVKSEELWTYVGIVVAATAIIAINIFSIYGNASDSIRHAAFQTASIITTTGYATTDFNLWPGLSKAILLALMFIGGCAGSTAGGMKVSRVVIMFKMMHRELLRMVHPRSVGVVKFEGKSLDEPTLNGVGIYFGVYMICMIIIFLLISFEPFGMETNFTAVVTCFNNVGPGFAGVGPAASFAEYSGFSKLLLSFAMLLGRLEIFPILLAMIPSTWMRKY